MSCLIDGLMDWWIDGLMDWWIGGLMGWWVGGLVDWWIGGLMDWWIDGLVDWWIDGLIGRSRSNPPLLTRVARMRADALWEMKRRRDNLREQSRLLHPELLAPDWLSGPHPPFTGVESRAHRSVLRGHR